MAEFWPCFFLFVFLCGDYFRFRFSVVSDRSSRDRVDGSGISTIRMMPCV